MSGDTSLKTTDFNPNDWAPVPEVYVNTAKRDLMTGRDHTDLVMGYLLEGLLNGAVKQGDRVNATQLADKLNVTIVPVREALHYLAGVGLIELLPLRGAKMRSMDIDEVADLWDVFRGLANIGLRRGASVVAQDGDAAAALTKAMDAIRNGFGKVPHVHFILALLDYHRVLHEVANLKVLDNALRQLQVVFWCSALPEVIPLDTYGPGFVRAYERIHDNLLWGNGEGAVAALTHHVSWSSEIINGARPDPDAPFVS